MSRRRLSVVAIEQILHKITSTSMSTRQAVAACASGSGLRNPYSAFLMRTVRDQALADSYLRAKDLQQTVLRDQLFEDTDEAIEAAGSTAALRAAKRQFNKALHRLDGLYPARLRNHQRAIADPRAADLVARRRRAGRARRMRRMAQNKEDRT